MSREVRILFTSVGRRVELMRAFADASLCTGVPLRIYGADMDETAPALLWCNEQRLVCRINDENYIPTLLDICKNDRIDLLIPTIDTDLLKLAESRELFEAAGTKVLIADADKVGLCRDKRLTGAFFESCGLNAPRTYDDWTKYTDPFPCFIKPKDGSSSIDAYKVENAEQLESYAAQVEDYIVQPFVSGREYTIDAFCDYEGRPVSIVPRERLQVRAGEVLKTRIDLDARMVSEAEEVLQLFRPRGPITIQLIRDNVTGEDWFIEINPRYGGGAPLSMRAGARTAEWVLRWLGGRTVTVIPSMLVCDGEIYSRFDNSAIVSGSPASRHIRGVIFDLDDTLYPERDYVRSGFRAVAEYLKEPAAVDEFWEYFLAGKPAIDEYVSSHDCYELKDEMLAAYRSHKPRIGLANEVLDTLRELRSKGLKLGIITDGRSEGQRAKLDALSLWDLVDDVIITDELGGVQFRKPCDIAYRIIQRRWEIPFENLVYVGDNTAKDFAAPRQLGMLAIHYIGNGLYSKSVNRDGVTGVLRIGSQNELRDVLTTTGNVCLDDEAGYSCRGGF